MVYYLQEAIAPDGYDTDPEIYVICDEESYKELEGTEVTNPATGATSKVTESSWLGSILGGKTVIGANSVIGGNSFITESVAPNTKASTETPRMIFRVAQPKPGDEK